MGRNDLERLRVRALRWNFIPKSFQTQPHSDMSSICSTSVTLTSSPHALSRFSFCVCCLKFTILLPMSLPGALVLCSWHLLTLSVPLAFGSLVLVACGAGWLSSGTGSWDLWDAPSTQLTFLLFQVLLDWSRRGRDLGTVRDENCWLSLSSVFYPPSFLPLHFVYQYMYLYSS